MDALAAMQRAIEISQSGLGKTVGNPIVGAVIFDETGIISEGFHASGPHAEVVAINNAKRDIAGASIAVTLEPCSHYGKTPPCTDALISAGIKKVYFALSDPNSIAAGGASVLKAANVEVVGGLLEEQAQLANRAWLRSIEKERPYFNWKIAITLDGKISAADGSSKWISNQISRNHVALMRSQSDAIMVGTGTVIADDPNLVPEGFDTRPLRIVVGTRDIPEASKVLDTRAELFHSKTRDFHSLIAELNARNIRSVLVEAGPTLGTAMMRAGLIDELSVFIAPKLLGIGQSFLGDLGITSISNALHLQEIENLRFGEDLFIRYQIGAPCSPEL